MSGSDLKHRTDAELVEVIQNQKKWRDKLEKKKLELEAELGKVNHSINNSNMKTTWAIKYLSSPYTER